jgi:hypothetical protein
METVMEMPVEAVVVAVMIKPAGRRGAGCERCESERSNGGESECEFLHGHLLSLCDAIRCGWVRDDLESVVSAGWVASLFDLVQSADRGM